EGADRVVRPVDGLMGVQRPNSDGAGLVTGRYDPTIGDLARAVLALVAGGADDHDARLDGPADGSAERIRRVTLPGIAAQRKIDHPDVVGAPVLHVPVEAGDHVAGRPRAVLV